MEGTLIYLARMNRKLIEELNNSRAPLDSSREMAIRVGEKLFEEGKRPELWQALVPVYSGCLEEEIIPVDFKGKWEYGWTFHPVCCERGFAYDPFVGRPVLMGEHPFMVFGRRDVVLLPEFSHDKFLGIVDERKRFPERVPTQDYELPLPF